MDGWMDGWMEGCMGQTFDDFIINAVLWSLLFMITGSVFFVGCCVGSFATSFVKSPNEGGR